jgi:hypothetical protein
VKLVFGHDRLSAVGRARSHCLVILPVVVFLPVVFSHSLTRDRVERARERRQDPVRCTYIIGNRRSWRTLGLEIVVFTLQ